MVQASLRFASFYAPVFFEIINLPVSSAGRPCLQRIKLTGRALAHQAAKGPLPTCRTPRPCTHFCSDLMPCMLSLYSSQLSSPLWPNHPSIQTPSPAPPGVKWPPSRRQNIRHRHVSSAEKEPRTPLPLPSPPPPRVSAGYHKLNLGLYKTFSRELWMQFETYFVSIFDRKNVQSIRGKIGKHLLEPFFFFFPGICIFFFIWLSPLIFAVSCKRYERLHIWYFPQAPTTRYEIQICLNPRFAILSESNTESSDFMSFFRIFYAKRM